jgi:hypothetical protein
LPATWTAGTAEYAGLQALQQFTCRSCQWTAAADAGLQHLHSLQNIDISFNPLVLMSLPASWNTLPLVTLKAS